MRLFVAIDLPDEVKEEIEVLQRTLPDEVKRVNPDRAHITLAFLGDRDAGKVKSALEKVRFDSFRVTLDRIGGFPNLSSARVLYLGGPPVTEALKLADQVNTVLKHSPDKPFRLHATIARVKNPVTFSFDRLKPKAFTFTVREFVLYASELKPHGPVYRKLATFGSGTA